MFVNGRKIAGMKWITCLLLIAATAFAGCSNKKEAPVAAAPTNETAEVSGNPLTAPADYLGVMAKAQKSAVRVVDTASLDRAIQMFQVEEERFPNNLQELVAKRYMPSIPTPPYGMKYDYNPQTGKLRIVKQ